VDIQKNALRHVEQERQMAANAAVAEQQLRNRTMAQEFKLRRFKAPSDAVVRREEKKRALENDRRADGDAKLSGEMQKRQGNGKERAAPAAT